MTTHTPGLQKTALTPHEKLAVAYYHECYGLPQHVLGSMYIVNPARINEAIRAVRAACDFPKTRSLDVLAAAGINPDLVESD